VLKELGRRGLIEREKRSVAILQWKALRQLAYFSTRYLHLEVGSPDDRRIRLLSRAATQTPGNAA
jgi:hypothetical protein